MQTPALARLSGQKSAERLANAGVCNLQLVFDLSAKLTELVLVQRVTDPARLADLSVRLCVL